MDRWQGSKRCWKTGSKIPQPSSGGHWVWCADVKDIKNRWDIWIHMAEKWMKLVVFKSYRYNMNTCDLYHLFVEFCGHLSGLLHVPGVLVSFSTSELGIKFESTRKRFKKRTPQVLKSTAESWCFPFPGSAYSSWAVTCSRSSCGSPSASCDVSVLGQPRSLRAVAKPKSAALQGSSSRSQTSGHWNRSELVWGPSLPVLTDMEAIRLRQRPTPHARATWMMH